MIILKEKKVVKEATGTIPSGKRSLAAFSAVKEAGRKLNLLAPPTGEDYVLFYCDMLLAMGDSLLNFSKASSVSSEISALMGKTGKNIKQIAASVFKETSLI